MINTTFSRTRVYAVVWMDVIVVCQVPLKTGSFVHVCLWKSTRNHWSHATLIVNDVSDG